jgi:acetyltransferase-like isoleucine patch superfamily enzyme
MGSVVLKDVEPNTVVACNPAKFLRVNTDKKVFK